MEPVLVALARFVAETSEETIPAAVRDRAALVVADSVGAILAGSQEPEVRRLQAGAERAVGPATVLGEGFPRVEPWWAITANGLAGTMLELDEGNRFARGHPGIHVLPAALAEAERLGRGGSALLSALIVGYDVAARLGGGAPIRSGMHMHGVHGAVGAAAAVARLRELAARRHRARARSRRRPDARHLVADGARRRDGAERVRRSRGRQRLARCRPGCRRHHAAAGHAERDLRPDQRRGIRGRRRSWRVWASASRSPATTSSATRAVDTTTRRSRPSRRSWPRPPSRPTGSRRSASRPRPSGRR